jgi:tetratricopeptide (TPR) repeat protein
MSMFVASLLVCGMALACSSDDAVDPEPLYRQAEELRLAGQLDDAIERFQETVAADPEYGPAYLGLAQVYSALDDQAEGEKNYLLAVAMAPDNLSAHLNFAGFYYRFRNYERALQVLQQAIEVASTDEDSALVSSLWTRVEAANVRVTVRRNLLDELAESPGEETVIARLAENYADEAADLLQGGNEQAALAVVAEGMQAVPEEAQAGLYYAGAQAQGALGNDERGFEWLQKAVELDGSVPVYRLSHAGFLMDRGELDEAMTELDRVIELAPGSEEAEFARIRKADVERMQQMSAAELQEYLEQRRAQRLKGDAGVPRGTGR